jgi:hypothetical protein
VDVTTVSQLIRNSLGGRPRTSLVSYGRTPQFRAAISHRLATSLKRSRTSINGFYPFPKLNTRVRFPSSAPTKSQVRVFLSLQTLTQLSRLVRGLFVGVRNVPSESVSCGFWVNRASG